MNETLQSGDLHSPLAGASIVITREARASAVFSRRVRALQGRPLLLPGLSLRPMSDAIALDVSGFDSAIFTSPAAVRFGASLARLIQDHPRIRVFAIGGGTARALARHGLRAAIPSERSDSEGLLALPELANVRGRRIALVGAPGGRDVIAPALRRRGAIVEKIDVYRRVPPRLTPRHFDTLTGAPDPLITLLSSGEALTHLVALLPAPLLARLKRQMLVVSSARLAAAAAALGFADIVQARSAAPADLISAAETALARHRL